MIIIAILLIGYSFLRYYHLWKRFRIPNAFYFVFQVLLLGTLFVCHYKPHLIHHEVGFYILQIIMSIYAGIMIYTPFLCFIRGAIRIIGKRIKAKGRVYRYFNHPAKTIYIFLAVTAGIGLLSFAGTKFVCINEYTVGVAETKNQMKIVWLTDAHMGTGVARWEFQRLIEKANAQNPDMILLGGDLFDENTTPELREHAGQQLKQLKAKYGVFFIEGSYEGAATETMKTFFRNIGINCLNDQQVTLGNGVQLLGCSDYENPLKKDMKYYQSMFFNRQQPILIFSHNEENKEQWEKFGADLLLSTKGSYGCKNFGKMNAITSTGVGDYGILGNFIPWNPFYPNEIVSITFQW